MTRLVRRAAITARSGPVSPSAETTIIALTTADTALITGELGERHARAA